MRACIKSNTAILADFLKAVRGDRVVRHHASAFFIQFRARCCSQNRVIGRSFISIGAIFIFSHSCVFKNTTANIFVKAITHLLHGIISVCLRSNVRCASNVVFFVKIRKSIIRTFGVGFCNICNTHEFGIVIMQIQITNYTIGTIITVLFVNSVFNARITAVIKNKVQFFRDFFIIFFGYIRFSVYVFRRIRKIGIRHDKHAHFLLNSVL